MKGELSSEGHKPLNKSKKDKPKLGVSIFFFLWRSMIPGLHFHGFPSMVSQIYQRVTLNPGGWMCPGGASGV